MPIPFIIGAIAALSGAVGVGKGVKGALDSQKANEVQEDAQEILRKAKNSMQKVKAKTTISIQNLGKTKIQASANELNDFVTIYSKIKNVELGESIGLEELKRLKITKESIKEMKTTVLGAVDVLGSGIAGVGGGALLGWGAYGGVMALGSASTGAAIGGLSGIAATNATLAWLGGGALAAGGGGMALGTAVLGGIVAGPALLLAGGIFGAKAKTKLNNAYSNLAEVKKIEAELKTAKVELKSITQNADQLNNIIKNLVDLLQKANEEMKAVVDRSTKWTDYSQMEKNIVIAAMKSAQAVKIVVDVPLLTEDGVLTKDIRKLLGDKEILAIS